MDALFTISWWILAGLALVAGIARGLTGFGVGLIMMPVGAVLWSPLVMVPLIAVMDVPVALLLLGSAWRDCDRRNVLVLAGSAVLCLPIGIAALVYVDAEILAIAANTVALLASVALLAGLTWKGPQTVWRSIGLGGLAGFLQGSVSIPGPPIILGWVASQMPGRVLRANVIMFFFLQGIVALSMMAAAGLFTESVLWRAASLAPVYVIGTMIGRGLFGKVPDRVFNRIVLGLVIAGAVSGIALTL